ncbi:hypothetical protein [Niabella drilacis]|uniref:hypothetical protein n=1 Tax=Niabella drilacis (strain DSM 25811 / CCM 8410 / CCUG 62505 / LMG 26954 / E90) TaxID=1285928 RepID=UPI00115FCC0B|nr:hypothetical protein [Niabella drilacis]
MKIGYHIILYSLLAAGILLFSMPMLRPACKRMLHQVSAASGKHSVPAGDMETPVFCVVAGIAIEPVVVNYLPVLTALFLKKNYPQAKTRFPADPFPECIDAPPRCCPVAI